MNHGKKFPKYSQTSFSGIVNSIVILKTKESAQNYQCFLNNKTDEYVWWLIGNKLHEFSLITTTYYERFLTFPGFS